MCCNLSHYPSKTGLFYTDGVTEISLPDQTTQEYPHFHIKLPDMSMVGICVSCGFIDGEMKSAIAQVRWTDFLLKKDNLLLQERYDISVHSEKPDRTSAQRIGELIAIGIAEGNELHREWIEKVIKEYGKIHKEIKWKIDNGLHAPPHEEWKILPPEALDYDNWLVRQAQKETTIDPLFFKKEEWKPWEPAEQILHGGLK